MGKELHFSTKEITPAKAGVISLLSVGVKLFAL